MRVDINSFPRQGPYNNKRVKICFNCDTANVIMGRIVRDDYEEPWLTIISLDDGRFILATECQFQPE